MGQKWPADQGSSDDVHTVQLLQLHGGRRSLPTPNLLHSNTRRFLPKHRHRKVSSRRKIHTCTNAQPSHQVPHQGMDEPHPVPGSPERLPRGRARHPHAGKLPNIPRNSSQRPY